MKTATERGEQLEAKVRKVQEDYAAQGEIVRQLEEKLKQLSEAKRNHEEELLGKFAVLLNEKKVKIRDQQRLLRGSKVDGERGMCGLFTGGRRSSFMFSFCLH